MYSLNYKLEHAHEDSIWSCSWMKNPTTGVDHVVTGSVDDLVKCWVWNEDRLDLKHTLEGHALGVVSVDINNEGTSVASSSLDNHLRLWDLETGDQIRSIDAGPIDSWTVKFSPDSKFIATGSHSGKINIYGVDSGKLESTLDTRGKFTLSIAYSHDGKYIASGANDGIINIFDITTGKLVHTLEGHAMPIRSLSFTPDSELLVTASDDEHMKIYNVQHANLVGTLSGHGSWVLHVVFSPDNAHFASCIWIGETDCSSHMGGHLNNFLPKVRNMTSNELSSDKTVKIWETSSRQCIHTFSDHTDQVWCAKYNTSGSKLVTVSDDRSIHVYDCPL